MSSILKSGEKEGANLPSSTGGVNSPLAHGFLILDEKTIRRYGQCAATRFQSGEPLGI